MRKVSGNGNVIIENEESSVSHNLSSRKNQNILVDLFFDSQVKIKRDQNSLGKVAFSSIEISDNMSENNLEWKKVLKKTGKHSKLYLKEEKLFAKQKGFVESANISLLETNPPNAYQLSENKFIFLTNCEIIKIEIKILNIINSIG
jgi:hypothetical protein